MTFVTGTVNFLSAGNPTTNEIPDKEKKGEEIEEVFYVQLVGTNANEGCTFSGTYRAQNPQGNFQNMFNLLETAFVNGSNVTLILDGCIIDDNGIDSFNTRPRVITVQLGTFTP